MSFFTSLSIKVKIVFLLCFVSIISGSILLIYLLDGTKKIFLDYSIQSEFNILHGEGKEIKHFSDRIVDDVRILSQAPPIQGIIRAQRNNGIDPEDESSLEDWKDRLSSTFISNALHNNSYHQIRYLDLGGNEIVAIQQTEETVYRIAEERLRNHAQETYMRNTITLVEDDVYISRPTLKKQIDKKEFVYPPYPIVHYAIPIFSPEKQAVGLIVIDANFWHLTGQLFNNLDYQQKDISIINQDGEYIYHKDIDKRWGSTHHYNTGENLKKDSPELFTHMRTSRQGTFVEDNTIYFYKKIFFDANNPNYYLTLLEKQSLALLFAPITEFFTQATIWNIFIFFSFISIFIYLLNKLLLIPLQALEYGAREIGQGNFQHRINDITNDEIGKVGKVLNKTATQLHDLYSKLDKKVKQRTKQIEKAQKELEEVSTRLKIATKTANIGIWEWDLKTNTIVWDKQMYAVYNIDPSEYNTTYETWRKTVHPDDIEETERILQAAINEHNVFNTSFRIIWQDKSIHHIKAFASLLYNAEGEPIKMVGANWDISTEKEVEQAKNEFVSLASHQLRTPLSSINWQAEFLLEGGLGKLPKAAKEYVQDIYDSNLRMIELVNALLNSSRIELGKLIVDPKPVNIRSIAESVLNELEQDIQKKHLQLEKKYGRGLTKISMDPNLTRIILQNFLTNAIKYTPEKGKINLSISIKKDELIIAVKDSGIGIAKQEQHKIYSKMFRTSTVQKAGISGTGLGLYIIQAIAHASGGKTWFTSKEGKGSTFYFSCPKTGMQKKEGKKSLI